MKTYRIIPKLSLCLMSSLAAGAAQANLNDEAFVDYIFNVICIDPGEQLRATCDAVVPSVGDPPAGGTGSGSQQTGNTGNLGAGELAARDKPNRASTEEDSDEVGRLQYERLGLFGSVRYQNLERDDSALERGYEGEGTVVTLGADYRATSTLLYGAAFSHSSRDIEFSERAGDVDTRAL